MNYNFGWRELNRPRNSIRHGLYLAAILILWVAVMTADFYEMGGL